MGKSRSSVSAASTAPNVGAAKSRQQRKRQAKRSQRPIVLRKERADARLEASALAFAPDALKTAQAMTTVKGQSMSLKARRRAEQSEIARLKMVVAAPEIASGGMSAIAAMRAHLLNSSLLRTQVDVPKGGWKKKKKKKQMAGTRRR